MNLRGIVLAGGKSRRFGEDKALLKVEGITLLERTVRLVGALDLEPVVITNPSRDYSFMNCRIEMDFIKDKGPLGGLYTACLISKNESLLVLTCDMPALTEDTLRTLLKGHRRENQVTLLHNPQKEFQPFPGVYESNLVDRIITRIHRDELSMIGFLKTVSTLKVIQCSVDQKIFLNINEKKDVGIEWQPNVN